MQNRYIIEDDAVTIIERWFPSEGKKKKILVLLLAFLTLFESHFLVSICPS